MNFFVHFISALFFFSLGYFFLKEQRYKRWLARLLMMYLDKDDQSFVVTEPGRFLATFAKLTKRGFALEGMPRKPLPVYPLKVFRLLASTKPYLLKYTEQYSGKSATIEVYSHESDIGHEGWENAFGKKVNINIISN